MLTATVAKAEISRLERVYGDNPPKDREAAKAFKKESKRAECTVKLLRECVAFLEMGLTEEQCAREREKNRSHIQRINEGFEPWCRAQGLTFENLAPIPLKELKAQWRKINGYAKIYKHWRNAAFILSH